MSEQRKHHRYTVEVAAEVNLDSGVLVATTQNMSSGGVGLVLDRPLTEGGTVGLSLFLTEDGIEDPDEEPLETQATIVWTAEQDDGLHTAGVRFAALTPTQAVQLERFLELLEK